MRLTLHAADDQYKDFCLCNRVHSFATGIILKLITDLLVFDVTSFKLELSRASYWSDSFNSDCPGL